tara:strand:+ start:8667 stop:8951 length:285 start_codon:yes stop_codon:yes gene_type:complete
MENKEIKIDEKEIKQIKDNREENSKMMFDFGKIKLERINLEHRMRELDKIESDMSAKYKGNISKEQKIAAKLNQKYGEGYINLDKGVFVPNEKK